jgi:hypothetical protein
LRDGSLDGRLDGLRDGRLDGWRDGRLVGLLDGLRDGKRDGKDDGLVDGTALGRDDGRVDGWALGRADGGGVRDGRVTGSSRTVGAVGGRGLGLKKKSPLTVPPTDEGWLLVAPAVPASSSPSCNALFFFLSVNGLDTTLVWISLLSINFASLGEVVEVSSLAAKQEHFAIREDPRSSRTRTSLMIGDRKQAEPISSSSEIGNGECVIDESLGIIATRFGLLPDITCTHYQKQRRDGNSRDRSTIRQALLPHT